MNEVLNRLHSIVLYLQGSWEFILSNELCTIHLDASFLLLCVSLLGVGRDGGDTICFSKCFFFFNKLILFLGILLTAWDNIGNTYSVSDSLRKTYIIFSSRLFTLKISSTRIRFSLLAPLFVVAVIEVVTIKKKKITLTTTNPSLDGFKQGKKIKRKK